MKKIAITCLLLLIDTAAGAQKVPSRSVTISVIGVNRSTPAFSDSLLRDFAAFYNIKMDTTSIKITLSSTGIEVQTFTNAVADTLTTPETTLLLFTTDLPVFILQPEYLLRGFSSKSGVAIVSSHKIKLEAQSRENYYFMLLKTMLHETGHLLGLEHCNKTCNCLMVSSLPDPACYLNSPNTFCPSCALKLQGYIH